ncbi:MAG: hypothetical protein JO016_12605 [Actinobacteria bacterium]|nr:hypothetical protein [Actinomycetota bacterium]
MRINHPAAIALAGTILAAALAGCTSVTDHAANAAASASAAATARTAAAPSKASCTELTAWNQRGQSAVKALYADTGALTADAHANNPVAVATAGRKLTSDAIAAATLPVPPVAAGSWKTLTAAYAAAGTALAKGDATGAVPQLQQGNTAISAFSSATARCTS